MIEITIPGEPVAQGRGRAVPLRKADGSLGARVVDPTKSRNWKAQAAWHMAQVASKPILGAVAVEIVAGFACPRSHWRKRVPRPECWKQTKPDLDNVVKAVKDAAKGVLWLDDSQVAVLSAAKVVLRQGEAPYVRVRVEGVGNAEAA